MTRFIVFLLIIQFLPIQSGGINTEQLNRDAKIIAGAIAQGSRNLLGNVSAGTP
jgi:hypothetical protein